MQRIAETLERYDFSIIYDKFWIFLPAAADTLKISAAAILVGLILGLIAAVMKLSPYKALQVPANLYIGVIRGTPILLQLFILYYGITGIVKLDDYPAAIIAFGIHNGAYIAEIFRGAIISIDTGQTEAARSLGMTKTQSFRRIVFPQAFKRAVPPLGNQFIIAIKDSSLASAISVRELLLKSQQLGASTYHFMEYFIIAGVYYLIISTSLGLVVNRVEKRLAVSDREVNV